MGYHTELNTLLRPPDDFDFDTVTAGKRYTVTLIRERLFPLHIAILLIDKNWNFYGYCAAQNATVSDGKTTIEFEILSVFTEKERTMYRKKFLEAARKTGEVT